MSALKWLATSLIVVFAFVAQVAVASPGNTFTSKEECVQVVGEGYAGGYLPRIEYHPAFTGMRSKMDLSLEKRSLGTHACVRMLVAGGETRWVYQSPEREFRWQGENPVFLEECGNPVTGIHRIAFNQPSTRYETSNGNVQVSQPEDDFIARRRAIFEARSGAPQGVTTATLGNLSANTTGGVAIVQGNQGMSTGGKILTGVAILGGAYVLDRALDRASKPRTVNNITNIGQCAGANVVTTGDGNIVCSNVTNPPVPVCNAPNRMIGGVCTTPPVCQGAAVLDQNSFTCQCVSPNRVFSSGICEVPRQCNAGETLGPDNVCRANGPHCRADQVVVGTQCQCPVGRVEVNGQCQVVVTCNVSGQVPVNGICQCPQGQQVIGNVCQVVQYCPDGSVRPANGSCPLVCTGGRIDRGGYCGCPVGQQEVNGFCQVPPQCRYDQILVGTTCQCPAGRVEVNGVCQVPVQCYNGQQAVNGVCQCPAGQQLIGGVCQTPVVCVGGQVPQGNNTCACPVGQELWAGVCRVRLECYNGQQVINGSCQCPTGQQLIGGVCQTPLICVGGQIPQGGICVCPVGQELWAGQCRVILPPGGSIN